MPNPRFFRFKLRTLMLLGLVLSIGLGFLGRQAMEAQRQRAVVASLVENGAQVVFNDVEPSLPEWLDTGYTSRVRSIGFDSVHLRDIAVLVEFKNLRMLSIDGTQVSDLSPLSGLENLESLELHGTQASDLSPLSKLVNLKWLILTNTQNIDAEQVDVLNAALPNCQLVYVK